VTAEQVRTRRPAARVRRFSRADLREGPDWCPPLKIEALAAINPSQHPFYIHGAAVQFLARRAGKVSGGSRSSDDPRYNAEHSANVGCFGMFETLPDPEVAKTLLNAGARWLRARPHLDHGPIDYSTIIRLGLLVEGFDTPQRINDETTIRSTMAIYWTAGASKKPKTCMPGGSMSKIPRSTIGPGGRLAWPHAAA